MGSFNPEHAKVLEAMLKGIPDAKPSKMFGYPAYKVNGKLAVGLHDGGIVAKVGPQRAGELIGKTGIEVFEPMPGRAWKDWVLLTSNFEQNRPVFKEAVQYVLAETSA